MSETVPATEVRVGDRILARGLELTVSRIQAPFLGRESYLAFIEDTERQWLKVPMDRATEVEVLERA